MQTVYLGTTNITSFETIRKISERVTTPSIIFAQPRVIVEVLMNFRRFQQALRYYINPAKITELHWHYIRNIKDSANVAKVSLYLAEKRYIRHQHIPQLEYAN